MIVRDEERYLGGCLETIAQSVDEIVVVDTGSTDATVAIAEKFGARVVEKVWTSDFSAARNCALECAQSDWILYIDADERLNTRRPDDLLTAIDCDEAVACWVRFQPRVRFTRYHELRLFRRDPRIRFRGAIHETVHPSVEAICRSDGMTVAGSDIRIDHVGYEGDLTPKYARNLPILKKAVEESPKRVFLWVDMAQALAGLGRRVEAEAACRRAIELAADHTDPKQVSDGALAWQCLIGLHVETDPARAAAIAATAAKVYPEHHALALALANALFLTGHDADIIPILEHLTRIDPETFVDPLVSYDYRIFGEWAYDLMGGVYARLREQSRAAQAYGRASELAPDQLSYRLKAAAFAKSR